MAIANTNIINDLEELLLAKIDELVTKTEAKDTLDSAISSLELDVNRLRNALDAIQGSTPRPPEPVLDGLGSRDPAILAPVPQAPAPVRTQPECPSCGGDMYYQSRALASGRQVNLWVCSDCSNERV